MQEAKLKEAAKQKQKELHNSKQDAHHYEQQAISSMMRSLSVSEDNKVSTQLHATSPGQEAKNWSRVIDKKEQKRKQAESAKQEEQALPEQLVRSPRTISERSIKEQTPPPSATLPTSPTTEESPSTPLSKSYNLDLSTLMPNSAKLSQKQRKRLSSESQSWRANSSATLEPHTPPVAVPNAWGVTPALPTTYPDAAFSSPTQPATGSISDPTSFANMMRGQTLASAANTQSEQSNSFSKILADEKRQRESYDRMRNKSLVHTQIEETAIAELREFYNVDRIDDEHITIERKSRPSNINFSTWTRH